jgi:hypothetical protein
MVPVLPRGSASGVLRIAPSHGHDKSLVLRQGHFSQEPREQAWPLSGVFGSYPMEALSEAFVFAEKNGVPRKLAAEILTATPLMANAYKCYGAAIADGTFNPPGSTVKDTVKLLGCDGMGSRWH